MRLRPLPSALVLGALLLLPLAWWATPAGPSAGPSSSPPPSDFRFTYAWPAGTQLVYDLRWSLAERAQVLGARGSAAQGRLALEGELVLRSFGREGEGWLLGASMRAVRQHDVVLMEQVLLPDAATAAALMTNHEARVSVGADGRVRSIGFGTEAPPLFRHLMQALLTEAQVVVPVGATAGGWEDATATLQGTARVRYAVTGALALSRAREAYTELHVLPGKALDTARQQLDSRATATLEPAGHLGRLEADEDVTVSDANGQEVLASRMHLSLERVRAERFDVASAAPLPEADDVRRPGELRAGPDSERQALTQRVDGLTMEELLADLRGPGNTGRVPDHNRWFWRATGLLKLQPELARQLTEVFTAKETTGRGRALVMDLLASAGTPEAQAVMREALDSRAARDDGQFPMLMQRLALVEKPALESATWLARERDQATTRGDLHGRRASAMALGAAAGGLWREGHEREAREHAEALRRTLDGTKDADERAVLVRALGNAALPEQEEWLRGMAGDTQAPVREAVATALRTRKGAEATATLLSLAVDPVAEVQQGALAALMERPLEPAELERLLQAVTEGRTSKDNDALLVTVLTPRLTDDPRVAGTLRQVLARTEDGALQARIRTLLSAAGLAG